MTKTMTTTQIEIDLNKKARELLGDGIAVVHATRDPAPPAPAWYRPQTGEAYVHLGEAGYDGTDKSMSVLYGLTCHELAHSRWSDWMLSLPKKMDRIVHDVISFIEEMRIEQRMVNHARESKPLLRAALPLVMGERRTPETKYDAARMWALVYGRAITTVAGQDEVDWVDETARTIIGDADVDYLTDLLQEGIETKTPLDDLPRIAHEWIDVVGRPIEESGGTCAANDEDADEGTGEGTGTASGEAEKSETASDTGPTDEVNDMDTGLVDSEDADREDRDGTLIDADDGELLKKLAERATHDVSEDWQREASIDLADPLEWAERVFKGERAAAFTSSPPKPHHHNQVAVTARVLENMVIPGITKVNVAAQLPPGRLRTREAVRASAERDNGLMVTARPWRGTKRTHSHSRPIVLGVATDVSGSMRWAERAVAEFAYIWSNAGRRVGARTAAVTFGDSVQRVVKPGEILDKIWTRPANGGTEQADKALAALDGVLKFSHIDGAAKVLIIVSDGYLVRINENDRVLARLEQFKRAGTFVVWVTPDVPPVLLRARKMGLAEVIHVAKYTAGGGEHTILDAIQTTVLDKLTKIITKA